MAAGDKSVERVERVVQDTDGSMITTEVEQPSDGNLPGLTGERSYRCVICGLAFKEHNVEFFRGKPYGVPCGDFNDIRSILLEERANRVSAHREEHRRRR